MRRRTTLLATIVVLAATAPAHGQIVTRWTFNNSSTAATIGAGATSVFGGPVGSFASGTANGGSTDTAAGTNNAFQTTPYPAQNTASGTAGSRYDTATPDLVADARDLVFRFDTRHSSSSSRFLQAEVTTDGTIFTPVGLFEAGLGGDMWHNARTLDLTGLVGVSNAPAFGVRLVTIFAPGANAYAATTPGTAYATTGTLRFDVVTLTAASRFTGAGGSDIAAGGSFANGAAPAATGTVTLGPAAGANTAVTVPAGGATLDQVVFRAGAPGFTVSGGTLTLAAGLANAAATAQTVSAPLAFGNQAGVQNDGTLNLTGTGGTFTTALLLQGTGLTNLSGSLTGNTAAAPVRVGSGAALSGSDAAGLPANGSASRVIFLAGSTLRVRVNGSVTTAQPNTGGSGTPGTVNSLLTAANGLVLNTGSIVLIDVTGTTFGSGNGQPYSFQIGTATSGSNVMGTPVVQFVQNGVDVTGSFTGAIVELSGANVFLNFTPVPEPMTVLAAAAAGLGGLRLARRRRLV